MQKQKYFFIIMTVLIPIIFWNFYRYVGFNTNITKMIGFVFSLLFLLMYSSGISNGLKTTASIDLYSKPLSLFIVVVLVSILNAYLYWGQTPDLTFRSGCSVFVLVSYFYFKKKEPAQNTLEIVMFILAAIYFLLWLYALSQAPNVVFGNYETVGDQRGFYRITQLEGLDSVAFVYFLCLTRISNSKTWKKALLIVITIACAIALFLSLTRMIIIACIMLSVYYIVRKKAIGTIAIVLIIVFFSFDYILSNDIVSSLVSLTEESSVSEQRTPEYTLAFELYPFHIGTFLFGNGSEHIASAYGQMEANLKATFAFNRSDAGFVGTYITYGITGVIILLTILWRTFRQYVSEKNYYLKLVVYFVFLVNITSYHFVDFGFTLVLSLYLLSLENINNSQHSY